MARQLGRAGIKIVLSNSRGPASLSGIASELGESARAGTLEEAAAADIVFLSTNWSTTQAALSGGVMGQDAKTMVSDLIEWIGLAGIDLGSLEAGDYLQQFPGGRCRPSISSSWADSGQAIARISRGKTMNKHLANVSLDQTTR